MSRYCRIYFHAVLPYNYGMELEERIKMLGNVIRQARSEKGWTQYDLYEKTGLSVGYISNIEKGYVNPKRGPVVPSDDTLIAISQALDIPIRRLHAELGRSVGATPGEGLPLQHGDIVRTLIREKRFDDQQFSGEEIEQIATGVASLIGGYIADKREARGEIN